MHKQHHHNGEHADEQNAKQNLVFHCQQAQGSPTGLVSNFSNVRELYQRVADCYDFPSDEVSARAEIAFRIVSYTLAEGMSDEAFEFW